MIENEVEIFMGAARVAENNDTVELTQKQAMEVHDEIQHLRARVAELEGGQEPWAYGWEHMGVKHVTQTREHAREMAHIFSELPDVLGLDLVPLYTVPPAAVHEDTLLRFGGEVLYLGREGYNPDENDIRDIAREHGLLSAAPQPNNGGSHD
jgi:hypothetical protein